MPTWDNTPPEAKTVPGIVFDNTAPASKTVPGVTFSNTAPDSKTVPGIVFNDSAAPFTDGFAGTDGQPIGDHWERVLDDWVYANNRAAEDPGGDGSCAKLTSRQFANGYVQVKPYGASSTAHRVHVRFSSLAGSHYTVAVLDGVVTLSRGATTLGSQAVTYAAGKVLRIELANRTITVKYDGATIITYTDNSPDAVLNPGCVALQGSESLGAVFDDFECGGSGAEPIPL